MLKIDFRFKTSQEYWPQVYLHVQKNRHYENLQNCILILYRWWTHGTYWKNFTFHHLLHPSMVLRPHRVLFYFTLWSIWHVLGENNVKTESFNILSLYALDGGDLILNELLVLPEMKVKHVPVDKMSTHMCWGSFQGRIVIQFKYLFMVYTKWNFSLSYTYI